MKYQVAPSPAPALARGIELLDMLEDGRPRTLEELAKATGVPKASALRLLRTLESCGATSRPEGGRRHAALLRLVPLESSAADFTRLLPKILEELARSTGFTAEWYEPATEGMLLEARAEKPDGEVSVRAGVGFLRTWDGELDSVAALGLAFKAKGCGRQIDGHWIYEPDGVRKNITAARAAAIIHAARSVMASYDTAFNVNGVRRHAAACVRKGVLRGVAALAATYRPDGLSTPERLRHALLHAVERLDQAPSLNPDPAPADFHSVPTLNSPLNPEP